MDDVVVAAAQRGRALLDLGRPEEAEPHLRTALAAAPTDSALLTLLGDALLRQRRFEEAEAASRSALAQDGTNVAAHSVLAASHGAREQYDAGLDAVRRALALAPEAAGLHLQEAGLLLALDRGEDAVRGVERARRLAPENADAAALLAAALCHLRRYDEASAAADEALRLDPENAEAHRVLGIVALRRGGGDAAVRAHRAAVRLDPTDAGSREGLSMALKTRNPLYRLLLRFSLWLDSLPRLARIAVLLSPLVLTRVLRPAEDQVWVHVLIIAVTVLALLSWTLEPAMNCVLLASRDRALLPVRARNAAYSFLAFASVALACAVMGQTAGHAQLTAVAFGFGVWAMATGSAHLLTPARAKVVRYGAAGGAVVGALAVAGVLAGAPGATFAVALVLLGGIAALWYTAFA